MFRMIQVDSGTIFYLKILLLCCLLPAILFSNCAGGEENKPTPERQLSFNDDWFFIQDSVPDAHTAFFEITSDWQSVHLPHDWSIQDLPGQDSLRIGPHDKNLQDGHDTGYIRGGTGWYRKEFTLDKTREGKRVYIHFDGIMSESQIWVNGQFVGDHHYGYTPFYFDITEALHSPGVSNTIAIKVVNPEKGSRWFTGAGIYRSAYISFVDPVHVGVWGITIQTPRIKNDKAQLYMKIALRNAGDSTDNVRMKVNVKGPDGNSFQLWEQNATITAGQKKDISFSSVVSNPVLWDLSSPALYTAIVCVYKEEKKIDEYHTQFGIRTIHYSADKGFLLNGNEVLLKGANLHHDNGLLGAAAFPAAEERKVRIMKENGFNAIRSAHNPASSAFIDACNRLGMLVIDESFDMWQKNKRSNDYHRHFDENWEKDLRAMIRRGINSPAIIMWSIGNEITERADSAGLLISEKMAGVVKSLDTVRPITMGVNRFWDNPGKEWEDAEAVFEKLDVAGYNYLSHQYKEDHKKFPERVMYGSETTTSQAYEYWKPVSEHPFVIGEFVWTGMDYLGEAGIGYISYETEMTDGTFFRPWPWFISGTGDLDITGNKKPASFYRDVIWNNSRLEMAVLEPVPQDKHLFVYYWAWPNELRCWNWPEYDHQDLWVHIYSDYPEVQLELNGELIGVKKINEEDMYLPSSEQPIKWAFLDSIGDNIPHKASFAVPWIPGQLKAYGLENGVVAEQKVLQTTDHPYEIKLAAEQKVISATERDIAFINLQLVDENGNHIYRSALPVEVSVHGQGELLAAGNGSPFIQGSFTDGDFHLYEGKGLIVVRSNGRKGEIKIKVSSELGEKTAYVRGI